MKEIVKLPREIWMLIFEYKQANFEREVREYVNDIFMYFPKVRPPHVSVTHEDLLLFRLQKRGGYVHLMFCDQTIDVSPAVLYLTLE